MDKETQKPKGFAFIEFFDVATAESAVRNMNNYDINGRTIRVNFADEGPDRSRGRGGDRGGDRGGLPSAPMPELPPSAKVGCRP
jgi:RNA recognition motif-containing protein